MKNFYFTFGQKCTHETHPNYPKAHPNGWVTIVADSYEAAREKSKDIFGLKGGLLQFAFQYDDSDFKPQYFPIGEIERFEVTAKEN